MRQRVVILVTDEHLDPLSILHFRGPASFPECQPVGNVIRILQTEIPPPVGIWLRTSAAQEAQEAVVAVNSSVTLKEIRPFLPGCFQSTWQRRSRASSYSYILQRLNSSFGVQAMAFPSIRTRFN